MKDFDGKVAVVTGAASGIGLGLATRFAEEGMKVVLVDVEAPALEAAVTGLRRREFDVAGVLTDVSQVEAVAELARKTLAEYGRVHILCNNAGVGGIFTTPIWATSLKDWQWTLGVNLWGVVNGIRAFVPIMLAQDEEAHIVNTASIAGVLPGSRIYGVTKQAVVALSEALNANLRQVDAKIGVSVLCPGMITTRIMYAQRNRPEELQDDPGAPLGEAERAAIERMRRLSEETGITPAEAAAIVVEAIRNERFYILTHHDFDEAIRTRAEDIVSGRAPSPVAGRPSVT
jgi:NAD(P)-dependent dehydrogenase (short-subunit alcohol dehydrogenase family)